MQCNNSVKAGSNISFPREAFHNRHSAFRGNKTHIILASSQLKSIRQSERDTQGKRERWRVPAGVMSYKHPVLRHAPSYYSHSGDRSVSRRGEVETKSGKYFFFFFFFFFFSIYFQFKIKLTTCK
jgi:hypothetical protein